VKLIEQHFVPVAIHNNNRDPKSADRVILKKFKEPAWNYQIVRFIGADEKDLIPRKDKVWTKPALAGRMIEALEKAKRPVPPGLRKIASSS
jgi:hypothetical protein